MGNLFSSKKESSPEKISSDDIKQLVFKILQNKDLNLSFVPDSIEAKIYEKILSMTINEIHQILSTVKIQFLDQEITLHMNPITSN
jgi:hypothetical protein